MEGRTLLIGSPGSGKSLLCSRMALNWADSISTMPSHSNKDWKPSFNEETYLNNISLLILIDLSRVRTKCDFESILNDQFVFNSDEDISSLLEYLEMNQKTILLILDAWDEYDRSLSAELNEIVYGRKLPECNVLISSRIREKSALPKNVDHTMQTKGFSQEQVKRFIFYVKDALVSDESHKVIIDFISQRKLWDLFSSPFLLTYLCLLHTEYDKLYETVTELLTSIILYIVTYEHNKKTSEIQALKFKDIKVEMLSMGKVALNGLLKPSTQTVFDQKQVLKAIGEKAYKLGLIHKVDVNKPLRSAQVSFGHKCFQEFIAAIYVVHTDEGFCQVNSYLQSLVEVYDLQLLIKFISGLDSEKGTELIKQIKRITEISNATAAQCPGFSRLMWSYDGARNEPIYSHDKAKETTPFLMECCWELASVSHEGEFNLHFVSTDRTPIPFIPEINLNFLMLDKCLSLLASNTIAFISSSKVLIYHVSVNIDNYFGISKLLGTIDLSDTNHIDIGHVRSVVTEFVIVKLINEVSLLKSLQLIYTELTRQEMIEIIQVLNRHYAFSLTKLYFEKVRLEGCETALCQSIGKLVELREPFLRSLQLPGFEADLCNAISSLKKLLIFDLSRSDMRAAGNALPACLSNLPLVQRLGLLRCNLNSDQVANIYQVTSRTCHDLFLCNMAENEFSTKSIQSLFEMHILNNLQDFRLPMFKVQTESSAKLMFENIPNSVVYLNMVGCHMGKNILTIAHLIQNKPSLQYLWINKSDIDQPDLDTFRYMCEMNGVVLITDEEEWKQNAAGNVHALIQKSLAHIRKLY